MSAENSQAPVGPSPLHSPTTSQQSTQTFSSEEEDAEGEKESPKEEPSFSKEDEFLGENGYLENYAEEDEYLQEAQFLTAEGYLYARDYLYKNQYLKWREYLQKEVGSNEQDYWYENDYPESRENLPKEVASNGQDYWYENDYPESTENLQEEVASKEQDYLYENDYPQRDLLNPKVVDMPTITYHFGSQSSDVEEPEKQEVKKPRHVVRRKKKLEIDTEWIKDKIEFVTPDMLSEMKSQVALEVDAGPWVRKIRVLLGKMSRVVNFLTISELENFLEASGILLIDNPSLSEKFRSRVEAATTLVPGSFSSY
ncbi:hypothetical protein PAL_GLEAN10015300 [Pteropus alecto]|uniref:Uncharacterized protein n=1 Tax=Pteropus alecto TaxID=9402 RepID=L5KEE5_PTEAL|nr:hypothetical protein PAL_GLEAN10015300 [Pteropus alecto]